MVSRLRLSVRARTDAVFRSVLRNTGWAAAGQLVSSGVSFGETIVLARYFSLNDFGVFVTLTSVADLIYSLLDFRGSEAVIKFIPEITASKGASGSFAFLKLILLLDVIVSIVGFAIIAILGPMILGWVSLQTAYFSPLLIISFGFATRGIVGSVESYFRICGRFDQATKLGSISLLARLALLVIVGFLMPTMSALSWAAASADLLYLTIMGVALFVALRRGGLALSGSPWRLIIDMRRPLTTFLVSTNLAYTVRTLSTKLDTLLIARLASPGVVAVYKLSCRLALSLVLFSDPLRVAIYPELSHLYASGRAVEMRKLLLTMTLALSAFASVLVAGFAITGRWILGTLAGPQYHSAYPVVLTMFAGSVVWMIFFWARPLLLVRGQAHTIVSVAIVALIVQVAGLYLLVPYMGALGAGLAFSLNYVVTIFSFLYFIFRSGGIGFQGMQTGTTKATEMVV